MAAIEHLSDALFHGTVHPFNVGDVIDPTDTSHTEEPHAYATTDLRYATYAAEVRAKMHNRRNPDDLREPLVYEVEHMSEPVDVWEVSNKPYAVDRQGFRVKRRVED